MIGLLEDNASDNEDIKQSLLGRNTMTFATAAEAFFTADRGEVLNLQPQQTGDNLVRWVEKMIEGAETDRQKCDRMAM